MKSTLFTILFIVLLPQHVFSQVDPLTMPAKDFLEWQEKHIKHDIAQLVINGTAAQEQKKDYKLASELYHKAIRGGVRYFSPYRLAQLFRYEKYHTYNNDSIDYYTKMAAEAGNAYAECDMGINYSEGWMGYSRDFGKALSWYRKSASKGYPEA